MARSTTFPWISERNLPGAPIDYPRLRGIDLRGTFSIEVRSSNRALKILTSSRVVHLGIALARKVSFDFAEARALFHSDVTWKRAGRIAQQPDVR